MAEESSSTSFQLSSNSSGYQYGVPAIGHNSQRDSSSEASSGTRRSRKARPKTEVTEDTRSTRLKRENPRVGRPPLSRSIQDVGNMEGVGMELEQTPDVGSRSSSSPPPLMDMSGVPVGSGGDVAMHVSLHRHDTVEQHNDMNVQDNRQVLVQQMVHDPSIVGQLAASAAANEVRARAVEAMASTVVGAEQRVSSVVNEASQAVASARSEAVVASAQATALSSELKALREREAMFMAQLESLRQENVALRDMVNTTGVVQGHQTINDNPNGAVLIQLNQRLQTIEENLERLESKMDTHQEYLQELWMSQVPIPVVNEEVGSPVFRLDRNDQEEEPIQEDEARSSHSSVTHDIEKKSIRTKELHHLKIPPLPDNASAFRTWRNAVRTTILSYDQSPEGLLTPWLAEAFNARGAASETLSNDSGEFPRFDRVIASVLCRTETLKSSFGLRVQSYVEMCETEGKQVRGRYILNLISKEFDTSSAAGAITSSVELFQLPHPQDSVAALKVWRDKVVYILTQLPTKDRPPESMLSQWIYSSLKKHPCMRRVIDRCQDSDPGPEERTFEYLWRGVEKEILQSQHDQNISSIREDLKRGPVQPKKTNAMPGGKGDPKGKGDLKGKGKGKDSKGAKDQQKGKGKNKNNDLGKGKGTKGEHPGKGNGGHVKTPKELTPEEKAASPCIYHQRGRCMRGGQCPYSHAPVPNAKAAAAPKASSGPATSVAKAAVALITSHAVGAQASYLGSRTCIEFVGDTGAGECLRSLEEFQRQGFPISDNLVTTTSHPIQFLTGGGEKAGTQTVGFWAEELQRLSNVYLLPQCPLALSIGKLCEEGFTFLWHGSNLPMLIPPSTEFNHSIHDPIIEADRVDHHVPIFRFHVDVVHGMPAPVHASSGGDGDGIDVGAKVDLESKKESGSNGHESDGEFVDDLPPNHYLTHLPKSKKCDTCQRAKLYEAPHVRDIHQRETLRDAREAESPTFFLEKVSIDHIITRSDVGNGGETCTLVIVDQFSGMTGLAPSKTKSAGEVEDALRRFCGKHKPGVVQVASDRAPEILSALKSLGFAKEPAAPYQKIHNPLAGPTIRTIKGSTAALLLHSGLGLEFWPIAQKYLEWSLNVSTPARNLSDEEAEIKMTRFEKALGYAFEGFLVLFGALVWYKEPYPYAYGPKGEPGLFLGAELVDGMLFKGNYKVWPIESFNEGVFKEFVTRTIAIPNGKWRFPAIENTKEQQQMVLEDDVLEELGAYTPSYAPGTPRDEMEKDKEPISSPEIDMSDIGDLAQVAGSEVDLGDLAHVAGSEDSTSIIGVGGHPGAESSKPPPFSGKRNRAITSLRIATWGKSPGCEGCSNGTYTHSKSCRDRFNELLNSCEPLTEPKRHEPPSAKDESKDHLGLVAPISGSKLNANLAELERGQDAVASIYLDAIDLGFDEEELSVKLGMILKSYTPSQKKTKKPKKKKWFVEYCCSENSACSRVAEANGIDYLGLSLGFGDLLDDQVFSQVLFWFQERKNNDEEIELWGSIPCGPYSPLQRLNVATQGPDYLKVLDHKREETDLLVDRFTQLASIAVESGGTVSFEWPKSSLGWATDGSHYPNDSPVPNVFQLPNRMWHGLFQIDGKKPLKEWRIVTTSPRLAVQLDRFKCTHGTGHVHDPIEGGTIAKKSGFIRSKWLFP